MSCGARALDGDFKPRIEAQIQADAIKLGGVWMNSGSVTRKYYLSYIRKKSTGVYTIKVSHP